MICSSQFTAYFKQQSNLNGNIHYLSAFNYTVHVSIHVPSCFLLVVTFVQHVPVFPPRDSGWRVPPPHSTSQRGVRSHSKGTSCPHKLFTICIFNGNAFNRLWKKKYRTQLKGVITRRRDFSSERPSRRIRVANIKHV